MNFNSCGRQAPENKLSKEFVEFIDLTDEDLEEVEILKFGGAHGGYCGCESSEGAGYYSASESIEGAGGYCGPRVNGGCRD
ncbi:hypothetical protein [Ktedonospora formicarum]|uniref:Uncharacterized protein n=1 Tax=Ktedonospora formicarum TaxID=2778364 RepID=A0A8J3IEU6_9CHLR|nr:hypothetical protein [Ktedonospora formicarum]GHO50659.1 hypothetical protein KSX_88220 [Ktedonospora formicarum]